MSPRVRPVPHAAALVLDAPLRDDRSLVVADVHLGLAGTPEAPDGPPGASNGELAERLLALCEAERAGRLVVAGDLKHPIVGVPPWLRAGIFGFFARVLGSGVAAEVVLGNHDVGLVRYVPREVEVHPPTGLVRRGVGVFHGHRWPSDEVLRCPTLVAGHLHPGFRFAPTAEQPDGKRSCWVRVTFATPPDRPRPRKVPAVGAARELVVLPAFHPLAGVESLNRERPERGRSFLYGRFLARGDSRAYLLDGTDLGPLPTPEALGPRARAG